MLNQSQIGSSQERFAYQQEKLHNSHERNQVTVKKQETLNAKH